MDAVQNTVKSPITADKMHAFDGGSTSESSLVALVNAIEEKKLPKETTDWLSAAQKAIEKKEYARAIECYEAFLSKSPENDEISFSIAVLHSRLENYEKATAILTAFSTGTTFFADRAKLVLAYIHNKKENFAKAAQILNLYLSSKENRDDTTALQCLAFSYYKQRAFPKAVALYQQILSASPSHVNTLNALGTTLIESKIDPERGMELIQQALSREPKNPAILDSVGWGFYLRGDEERAVNYLRQAFELSSSQPEIRNHLVEAMKLA